jgi:hypothetical protein
MTQNPEGRFFFFFSVSTAPLISHVKGSGTTGRKEEMIN